MHWTAEYLGKPWRNGAAGPDAFDCYGLVRAVYRDRYGVEYEIDPLPAGTTNLVGGGMSKNLRLRFKLVGKYRGPAVPVGSVPYYPPGVFPPGYRTGLILQFDDQPYDPVGEGYGILRLDYRQFYYPPVSDPSP